MQGILNLPVQIQLYRVVQTQCYDVICVGRFKVSVLLHGTGAIASCQLEHFMFSACTPN